jgi:hypothetical protein
MQPVKPNGRNKVLSVQRRHANQKPTQGSNQPTEVGVLSEAIRGRVTAQHRTAVTCTCNHKLTQGQNQRQE